MSKYYNKFFHTLRQPQPKSTNNKETKKSILTLPEKQLMSCICSYCNCYVSIAPVRMVKRKIACGRCRHGIYGIRLEMVEALAMQFTFPCRYKKFGCNAELEWAYVDEHEKVCVFMEINCTVDSCDWSGDKSSIQSHLEQKHINSIINSGKSIMVDLQETKISKFLYALEDKFFFVWLFNDGKDIHHQVNFFFADTDESQYKYNICVYNSEKRVMFLNQKIHSFDDAKVKLNADISVEILRTMFANCNDVNVLFDIKCVGVKTNDKK